MTPTSTHRPLRRPALLTGALALTVLLLAAITGCGAGGSGDASSDSAANSSSSDAGSSDDSAGSVAADAPATAPEEAADAFSSQGDTSAADGGRAVDPAVPVTKAVISTGTVSLRSKDVGALLFDVQKVVDSYRGEIAERTSESDDDGALLRSRLVVRVPAGTFGDAMGALEETGTLISSNSASEDVTTQVIDTDVRIATQKASIDRIQALLAQAVNLKDVVAIESQLTSRTADLDSLEQTQAYLADQTGRSTITVSLERTPGQDAATEKHDDSGFLAGLGSGWDALRGFLIGLSTVAGVLLPWLVMLGVVLVPGVPLVRRLRRRSARTPEPAPSA